MCREMRVTTVLLLGLLFFWTGVTWAAGPLFLSGDDADDSGHCRGTACGALYPKVLRTVYEKSTGPARILVIGVNGSTSLARTAFDGWNLATNGGPGVPLSQIDFLTTTTQISNVNATLLSNYRMIYVPSGSNVTSGGLTQTQLTALNSVAVKAAIQTFVNSGGGVLALTEQGLTGAYSWFPVPTLTFTSINDTNIDPTSDMAAWAPNPPTTNASMDHCCYHTMWTGTTGNPNNFGDLKVLARTMERFLPAPNGTVRGPVILGRLNSPPVAVNDNGITTNEDTFVDIDVVANDTDVDNANADLRVAAGSIANVQGGTATLQADGRTVRFTPALNANSSNSPGFSFTYRAFDGSATSENSATVTITVTAVNDPPSFTKGADQTVLEDAGLQTVANWATNITAGPTADELTQTLTFLVSNDNNALFAVQPAIAADGTLTYTLAPNANGVANVTVRLMDNGGTANLGVDTSAQQTFTITVNGVNDAPNLPTSLQQYKADGTTSIATGGTTYETTVVFTATVSDVDSNSIKLQVEVKPIGTTFDETGIVTGAVAVGSGGTAAVTVSGLAGARYHWQARAIDDGIPALNSDWVSFGGNLETDMDFGIPRIITVAGTGNPEPDLDGNVAAAGFNGDGTPATGKQLNFPYGVAVDGSGNVYIADKNNSRIRKLDTLGNIITTVVNSAGLQTSSTAPLGDGGFASNATLNAPYGVALNALGTILYIADLNNQRIRKVDLTATPSPTITTVAGTGDPGFNGDGVATTHRLWNPTGVAVDAGGNLYIADSLNYRIRKVDTSGNITTVAGTGAPGSTGDGGSAMLATLNNPVGVALDSSGNLYIADKNNNRVRKVDSSTGIISTVTSTLSGPTGVAVDGDGNLLVADSGSNRILKVNPSTGGIITVAGTGVAGFTDDSAGNVAATAAMLRAPSGVAPSGPDIYIADYLNHRVRKVGLAP